MTTEEATEILGVQGSMPCTIHFWASDTPSKTFDTVHDGLCTAVRKPSSGAPAFVPARAA